MGSSSFTWLGGASLVDAVYTFSNTAFLGNDIALVRLVAAVNVAKPILNDLVIGPDRIDTLGTLTMVTAQNQYPNGYAATTAYEARTTLTEEGVISTVNWLLTHGGARVQGGDSGGALFLCAVDDSAGSVSLGITSASLSNDEGPRQGSAFVQVASYKNWIDSTLAGSGQHVIWASSVPESSALAMWAAVGLLLLAWRTGHSGRNG